MTSSLSSRAPAPVSSGSQPIRTPQNLIAYLSEHTAQLESASGGKIDTRRVIRLCGRLLENPRNSALLRCSLRNFTAALVDCLLIGVYPAAGHGSFIPAEDRVIFLLGYQGMIELAAKSGIFVRAYNVFKGDEFFWSSGSENRLRHVPNIEIRRSEETFLCSYCISVINGRRTFDVMLKNEIDAVRDRTPQFNMTWATDYLEMARKTVVRRASKFWPVNFELGVVRPFGEPGL